MTVPDLRALLALVGEAVAYAACSVGCNGKSAKSKRFRAALARITQADG